MNLNDLATFLRVAELGTFSAVAAEEGVPKSTISRRVSRLEDELGVALLHRASRSFSLTAEGRGLHARGRGALRELRAATHSLMEQSDRPAGRFVLTAPEDLGLSAVVVDVLAEYCRLYPEVEIDLRLHDRFVDLIAEGIDLAVRVHTTESVPGDGALIARKLGTMQGALYAGPGYVGEHGVLRSPGELLSHRFVVQSTFVNQTLLLRGPEGSYEFTEHRNPAFACSSMLLVAAMVERDAGIGILPGFIADQAVEEGRLVRLLPDWWMRASDLTMVWPMSRHLAPRVRAFVELASERLTAGQWMCVE